MHGVTWIRAVDLFRLESRTQTLQRASGRPTGGPALVLQQWACDLKHSICPSILYSEVQRLPELKYIDIMAP